MGEMVVPAQTEISEIASAIGLGFIVIVYDFDGPLHPFIEGVIIMVAPIGSLVEFLAVKVGRFPSPFTIKPIAVFVFFHENSKVVGVVGTAGVPNNAIWGTVVPTQ